MSVDEDASPCVNGILLDSPNSSTLYRQKAVMRRGRRHASMVDEVLLLAEELCVLHSNLDLQVVNRKL